MKRVLFMTATFGIAAFALGFATVGKWFYGAPELPTELKK